MARSKVLAFVQAPVETLLHAGRPEGERHHADQEALRQEKEAERKAQEANLVERTHECHHGNDRAEQDEKCKNRKEERLPTVTITSGLFRHRSSPFKKRRAANEVPVEAPVAYGKRRHGRWFGLTPKHGKLEASRR